MTSHNQIDEVSVLKLTLHGRHIGYLAGFENGRNILSFTDEFKADSSRPTFSLITHPSFPNSEKLMSQKTVGDIYGRSVKSKPSLTLATLLA